MVIIRDLETGEVIGKEASARYVPTRKLRAAREQALCDAACGIDRTALALENEERARRARMNRLHDVNQKRDERGLAPLEDHSYCQGD
jgi:hypothetical protein